MADTRPPIYVTGADDHLLGNLFMLLSAIARHEPEADIRICDFGFSPAARRFLTETQNLMPKPAFLATRDHPWYAKAAMGDFLPPGDADGRGFVWIDADIIPLRPFDAPVRDLSRRMQADGMALAVCPDDCGYSLSEFITVWRERDRDIAPFDGLLTERALDGGVPYLNSGFLLCRDPAFAQAWRDLVLRQHVWLLFEQNCFNTLAYSQADRLLTLDTAVWNAHGSLLDRVAPGADGSTLFVHATSAGDKHVDGELTLGVAGKSLKANLKLFVREDLRHLQLGHLEQFMNRHADAMIKAGLLT